MKFDDVFDEVNGIDDELLLCTESARANLDKLRANHPEIKINKARIKDPSTIVAMAKVIHQANIDKSLQFCATESYCVDLELSVDAKKLLHLYD